MTTDYINVDGIPYGFGVCEFSFPELILGPEVSVVVRGSYALRLKIDGDVSIATDFHLDGKTGINGIYSAIAGPGGWNGGRSFRNANFPEYPNTALSGMGPGGGGGFGNHTPTSAGGSYGGAGSRGEHNGTLGFIYGDQDITQLVGGSGGGRTGGPSTDAGGGGGALSIVAGGSFILKENATLSANGGNGISHSTGNGSGGSGGAIRIEAANIQNLGRVEALGGDTNGSGGAGGGGRIAFITAGTLVEGNYSVSAGNNPNLAEGLEAGDGIFSTITYPSLPEISEQNLTFNHSLTPLSLGLSYGLDYNITGLPKGLEVDNLELTGTPQQAGTFSVVVKGSNRFGEANSTFTIHVAPVTPRL